MCKKDKASKLVFDDYTENEKDCTHKYWTQLCAAHIVDLSPPITPELDAGESICGVKGCDAESLYYYDFDENLKDYIVPLNRPQL